MISTDTIHEILAAAVNAPSGDNTQPWRFAFRGGTLSVFNIPDRDPTLYNFRERGSHFAHGALTENIVVAAAARGYEARVNAFPGTQNCTAEIVFSEAARRDSALAEAMHTRATNRKQYDKRPLDPAHAEVVRSAAETFAGAGVRLALVEGDAAITELARAVSQNERLLMENRPLHDFLFSMIRWTAREESARPGLYIKTMEFPLPMRFMFKYVLCHWPVVTALNRIGFSKSIPKQSSEGYRASSAIGAVIIRGDADADYFAAGRAFERVWLAAIGLGLSIQPITALPYLAARVKEGEAAMFTDEHRDIIRESYGTIARGLNVGAAERIAMLFRIGYDGAPSAYSSKLPPVIEA